ncbi:MAG: tetratricopeptide repeat protein [Armatimonadota bacterium]
MTPFRAQAHVLRRLSGCLTALVILMLLGLLSRPAGAAPTAAPAPVAGTTLIDRLQAQGGDIRTTPVMPRVGAWGILLGNPESSKLGVGAQIDKPKQAVVYPTTELLSGAVGTIRFSAVATTAVAADDATNRVLLDSWSIGNTPARITLGVQSGMLTLTLVNEKSQTTKVQGKVNWAADSIHRIAILWDENDLALLVDGGVAGKAAKPALAGREPLGLALGNSRELNAPAKMAVSDLRLSNAREDQEAGAPARTDDNPSAIDLILKKAQSNERRIFPLLERMRGQGIIEVDFSYAMAYSDTGDIDRALATVTPISTNNQHPLYVQAIFLRASLLADQRDYIRAYEQLQMLTSNADVTTSVRAQVKQAQILYDQGNKPEAMRVIGEIISRYPDLRVIKDAYLLIGLDRFKSGNFQDAFNAFNNISFVGGKARETVAIGDKLEIKVADSDLNVRISDAALPVTVASTLAGDKEAVLLRPAFSRGVYIGRVETALGEAKPGDGILQVLGNDKIEIIYTSLLGGQGEAGIRKVSVGISTDAKLTILAQAALDIYREVVALQKKDLIDDRWELIGDLPETASEFFRDPDTGMLKKRGTRFPRDFISNIKAGQSVYVEMDEADLDISNKPDTGTITVRTRSGKTMEVTLTETGNHTGIFAATVKTTPQGTPKDGLLEVTDNDVIIARYVDPTPAAETRNPNHESSVTIRPAEGTITCGMPVNDVYNKGKTVFMPIYRIAQNGMMTIKVEDRDLDETDQPDTLTIKLKTNTGAESTVKLTETGNHTGVFTATVKITTDDAAAGGAGNTVRAKPGDVITAEYIDAESSQPKHERLFLFKVNIAEDAKIKFFRQVVEKPKTKKGDRMDKDTAPVNTKPPKVTWEETTIISPGNVYRIQLTDGDILKTSTGIMTTKMLVKSTNGAWAEVLLEGNVDPETMTSVFQGDFYARLGDKNSPTRAFVSQTGAVMDIKDADRQVGGRSGDAWAMPALNVQGNDTVTAVYSEPLAADSKKDVKREITLRIGADAELSVLNMKGNPIDQLKPGMPFLVQVDDANGDLTPKRDTMKLTLTSSTGDTLDVDLIETDVHSGIFSALINTAYGAKPTQDALLQMAFQGKVTIAYRDNETVAGVPADRAMELASRPMAEAEGVLLTKIYDDAKFEVETLVRLGESLYAVGAAELATKKPQPGEPRTNAKLQEASRLLQRVIERFPASDYVVESLYLTGKILREEQKYDESFKLFTRVIEDYPDSEFVPPTLYQLIVLYLDRDDVDNATETAIRLVHAFSKSPLVADAFLQIAEYYYGKKQYLIAANIYARVVERFPDNPRVELIAYRMATAYYRDALTGNLPSYATATKHYLAFGEAHQDSELYDDALYWAAYAYQKQGNPLAAYKILSRLLLTAPADADMLPYARRLRDTIKEANPRIAEED